MGIKDLWELIAPAERRYNLEELCGDRWLRSDAKALRLAIDTSIWTFQAQSSQGGRQVWIAMMVKQNFEMERENAAAKLTVVGTFYCLAAQTCD